MRGFDTKKHSRLPWQKNCAMEKNFKISKNILLAKA